MRKFATLAGVATIGTAGAVAYLNRDKIVDGINEYFGNEEFDSLTIGGFNMQYGPYKISRISKDTTGLDPFRQDAILKFNKFCMGSKKAMEESKPKSNEVLGKIFGNDPTEYEKGLVECLNWKQDEESKGWFVDVGSTFATYFDPINHQLWTSALIDTTPQMAHDILGNRVDVMALVETSNGIENSKGEIIPHTDNLVKLVENLNEVGDSKKSNYQVATYAQFTNPAAKMFPQLDRGNAIIYNNVTTELCGCFTIDISSEKRGKVTTRRYPVCLFESKSSKNSKNSPVMVCAAHVSGYAHKDSLEGGNPKSVEVGDRELAHVLKVLTLGSMKWDDFERSNDVKVTVGDKSYELNDPELLKTLNDWKVLSDIPTVVIGDFNQDFNKNAFEYDHKYRFPTFVPHDSKEGTVATDFGFENGYSLAKKIHWTCGYDVAIDGFLTKNIKRAKLLSRAYDATHATSDHAPVYVRVGVSRKD